MPFSLRYLASLTPYARSTPALPTEHGAVRPLLERLYESAYGCPPEPGDTLAEQAAYLKFLVPTSAPLDVAAALLADLAEA